MPDLNPNPTPQEVAREMLDRPDVQYSPEAYRSVIRSLLADAEALVQGHAADTAEGATA